MKSIGYVAFRDSFGSAVSGVVSLRGARGRATNVGQCTVREVFVGEPIAKGETSAPALIPPLSADVQERLALLAALQAAGVDNWDGYSEAVRYAAGEVED